MDDKKTLIKCGRIVLVNSVFFGFVVFVVVAVYSAFHSN